MMIKGLTWCWSAGFLATSPAAYSATLTTLYIFPSAHLFSPKTWKQGHLSIIGQTSNQELTVLDHPSLLPLVICCFAFNIQPMCESWFLPSSLKSLKLSTFHQTLPTNEMNYSPCRQLSHLSGLVCPSSPRRLPLPPSPHQVAPVCKLKSKRLEGFILPSKEAILV